MRTRSHSSCNSEVGPQVRDLENGLRAGTSRFRGAVTVALGTAAVYALWCLAFLPITQGVRAVGHRARGHSPTGTACYVPVPVRNERKTRLSRGGSLEKHVEKKESIKER